MTVGANRALVARLIDEVFNGGRLELLDELAAPGMVAGGKGYLAERRRRFPDLRYTVEDVIAEGDRVVTRLRMHGTDLGDFGGRAPTGRAVEADAVFIWRIAEGRVVDMWSLIDHRTVERQLGLYPG